MNDLVFLAIYFGCLLATLGLVRLCGALMPGQAPGAAVKEEGDHA